MSDSGQYWHVIVDPTAARRQAGASEAVAVDRDRDWVEKRILDPRRRGEPIMVSGRAFPWSDVERLRITRSSVPSSTLLRMAEAEDAHLGIAIAVPDDWRAADSAEDVTDDLVDGPPGSLNDVAAGRSGTQDPRAVMVVHGRDRQARRALFDFLRSIGLAPREWAQLLTATGTASPYIGEVLERAFLEAQAVVVLLTGDDEARLRESLRDDDEPTHEKELTPQARPNVLLEAGMALGVHPTRTVLVELGAQRPISDLAGRHTVRLDGTEAKLRDLARRLETAGCPVDLSGDDWSATDRFPVR